MEMIEALHYKLCMFGVPIEGPANAMCDNLSLVTNSTLPTSTLKKKHNTICYHCVQEAVAAKIIQIAHIPMGQNLADILAKPLGGSKLHEFCKMILYQMGQCHQSHEKLSILMIMVTKQKCSALGD